MDTILKRGITTIVATGGIALALFTFAQTPATLPASNIPPRLAELAKELGCDSRQACETAFGANLTRGLDLAVKYKVYNAEEAKLADSLRKEVLTKLAGASDADFESEIVRIAEEIVKNKPSLAKQFGIEKKEVEAARVIVTEIKKEGVDLSICSQPAESLTKEQLISCFNASKRLAEKKSVVGDYIPGKSIVQDVKEGNAFIDLGNALLRGEYAQLGTKDPNEAGIICLRPNSPSVCDQIAQKFFGADGVKELARARTEVADTETNYKKGVSNLTLVLPDGKSLVGKEAIRGTCEDAFRTKNIEVAKACGDLSVKNGFSTQEEVERSLKLVRAVRQDVNISDCRNNPKGCETFTTSADPYFAVMSQIQKIMEEEIGFSPDRCDEGESNQEIGQRCFEGSKRALPKIKILAKNNPAAERMVREIEQHVREGEQFMSQKGDIEKAFQIGGGPGGCKSKQECSTYCSDPTHGPECLSFGAKYKVINKEDIADHYEQYYEDLDRFSPIPFDQNYDEQTQQTRQFFNPKPDVTQNRNTGQPPYYSSHISGPSPECIAAISSGDFARAKEICSVGTPQPYPDQQNQTPYPQPRYTCPATYPIPCPEGQYRPEQRSGTNTCPSYSACVPIPEYQTRTDEICPSLPTVTSCGEGQTKIISYSSQKCGTYYSCQDTQTKPPVPPSPGVGHEYRGGIYYSPGFIRCMERLGSSADARRIQEFLNGGQVPPPWGSLTTKGQTDTATCEQEAGWTSSVIPQPNNWVTKTWNFTDGSVTSSILNRTDAEYANYIAPIQAQCLTISKSKFVWKTGAGNDSPDNWKNFGIPDCSGGTNQPQTCPSGQYWNGSSCVNSTNPTCPSPSYWDSATNSCKTTQTTPSGQKRQIWNSLGLQSWIRADADPARIESLKTACQNIRNGANIWQPGAGDYTNSDFGMPDPSKCQRASACTSTQYFNGTDCVSTNTQQTGQCDWSINYWKSSTNTCVARSTCYETTNQDYNTSECQGVRGSTQPTQTPCSSGQYWNGSSCVTSTNTSSSCSSSLIALLGEGCHPMFSDSSGNQIYCDGPMSKSAKSGDTATTPGCQNSNTTPQTCSSGQYWNGTACMNSTTQTCSSGQYWNGSTCVNSTQTTTSNTTCPAPSYWDSGTNSCRTTQTCSSGQYWNGTACVNTSTTDCPTGQYWNGTSCVNSPTNTYSSDPATACGQAGGTWNASTNFCQMPGSTPPPSASMYQRSTLANITLLVQHFRAKLFGTKR